MLKKTHRGRGIYKHLFRAREAHAQSLGGFDIATFCCVQRPADHPLRPADYVPLNDIWNRFGYREHPELETSYDWKDIDKLEIHAQAHALLAQGITPRMTDTFRIAAAAYPIDFLGDWKTYEAKITRWVDDAATAGSKLLVFPEYFSMELASLFAKEVTNRCRRS